MENGICIVEVVDDVVKVSFGRWFVVFGLLENVDFVGFELI